MSTLDIPMAFLVIAILWGCVFVWLGIKSHRPRGDDRRKYARLSLLAGMGFCATMGCQAFFVYLHGGKSRASLIAMSLFALALVMGIVGLWNINTDRYFRKLYDHDPSFCGRCGYDLTSNVSGVCPECGWRLPDKQE
jgi:hypothetical protein